MADGFAWEDLPVDLEAPGSSIRRKDLGGMATCLIRFAAGEKTDEVFAGLPDGRCQCGHWGYVISGTMRVHGPDGYRDYTAGEIYYWAPGHNLEALTDAEYFEVSRVADYEVLMDHVKQVLAAAADAAPE